MFTLLFGLIMVIGMVSSGPATPPRDRERDPEAESSEYRFGREFLIFTVLCAIALAVIVVLGAFSFFGAFTEDAIDPPV